MYQNMKPIHCFSDCGNTAECNLNLFFQESEGLCTSRSVAINFNFSQNLQNSLKITCLGERCEYSILKFNAKAKLVSCSDEYLSFIIVLLFLLKVYASVSKCMSLRLSL